MKANNKERKAEHQDGDHVQPGEGCADSARKATLAPVSVDWWELRFDSHFRFLLFISASRKALKSSGFIRQDDVAVPS